MKKVFIEKYAKAYSITGYDEDLFSIGKKVRKRNQLYLTKEEFSKMCAWKLSSYPINKHYLDNTEDKIIQQTKKAFGKITIRKLSQEEKLMRLEEEDPDMQRFDYLRELRGVGIPVASTILTIVFPEDFAIIDQKAWKSMYELGLIFREAPKAFCYEDWFEYIGIIRKIAREYNFTARYVEKAFFTYQWKDKLKTNRKEIVSFNPNVELDLIVVKKIKENFKGERYAKIPLLKGKIFKAELVEKGIYVNNLGTVPMLPWTIFTETVNLLKKKGGRAIKGNAMNYKLGEKGLPIDSVEGYIAHKVYKKKYWESVFRRITPISAILDWAGVCKNEKGYLVLKNT